MFSSILVPLDGSSRAEQILPMAAHIARMSRACVVLVRVITTGTQYWSAPLMPSDMVASAVEDEKQRAWCYLMEQASQLSLKGVAVDIDVRWGPVVPSLLYAVRLHHCDLVMMCHKKRSGTMHPLTSNVSEQFAQYARLPVFFICEGSSPFATEHFDSYRTQRPQRILVGLDDSSDPLVVIDAALSLMGWYATSPSRASIHIMHCTPMNENRPDVDERKSKAIMQDVRHYLDRKTGPLSALDDRFSEDIARIPLVWSFVHASDSIEALFDVAEHGEMAERPDAMVLSSTFGNHSSPTSWHSRSVGTRLIQETHLPVLLVPSSASVPVPSRVQVRHIPTGGFASL